jgi:hypothetical protein
VPPRNALKIPSLLFSRSRETNSHGSDVWRRSCFDTAPNNRKEVRLKNKEKLTSSESQKYTVPMCE